VQGKPSQIFKNLALKVSQLYQKNKRQTIDDFKLPSGGKLSASNRWVKMTEMISWDNFNEGMTFLDCRNMTPH